MGYVKRGHGDWYAQAMESLVGVLQELSLARDVAGVQSVVKRAARSLTGADCGATFRFTHEASAGLGHPPHLRRPQFT